MSNDLAVQNMFEGYGQISIEERDELIKAMQAQEGVTDIALLQGGGALQPQSLETQLAMLTFQDKHLRLYKDISTHKAFSTLEEYSVQDGYGTEGGFVSQLENPEDSDPTFRRAFAVVKYIRTMWKVSDVLQYARTITDAEVKAVQAAMMRALRICERTLFFGDTDIISSSFDGILKTVTANASTNIIDMRGGTFTEALFKQACEAIASNYGTPTDMYLSNSAQTVVDNLLVGSGSQRFLQEGLGASGLMPLGHSVPQMRTSFGNFNFKPDIFINPESQGVPTIKDPSNPASLIEGATSNKSPATPTFALTPLASPVSGSLWATSGDGGAIAGLYNYRVVAVNQYGKSIAAAAQSATVAAGGAMRIAITSGAGTYAETAYEIYRETAPGSTKIRYLTSVKKTGSPMNYDDKNENIAGTSVSFLLDNTAVGEARVLALSQLAPMHKVEYAKIAPYRWGTVNFYAVPKFYSPLRLFVFKNVGIGKEIRNQIIDL